MKVSISRVKLFKSCRRAYYFRYVEGLIPIQPAEALQTGTSYHELIEKLYATGEVEEGFTKEHAMAVAYKKYIYPRFDIKAVEDWKSANIGEHELIGRLDGIALDGCIVEHKTTSSEITEEYEYMLQWDEQILAYMYMTGARKIYYTVCRKPTIRLKKNETEEEFFNRMIEWYEEDTDSKIRMLTITRTDEEVEEFARSLNTVCDIMSDAEDHTERLYRNPSYCNKWGRMCEYAGVCLNYDPNQEYIEYQKREDTK